MGGSRRRVACARSLSDMPPQIPKGSHASSAWVRQATRTGQSRQISFAREARASRAFPRSPSGWKNTELLTPRQAACICHCQTSARGAGRFRGWLMNMKTPPVCEGYVPPEE